MTNLNPLQPFPPEMLEQLRATTKDFPNYRERCKYIEKFRSFKRRQFIVFTIATVFATWSICTAPSKFDLIIAAIITLGNAWFLADAISAFLWALPRIHLNNEAIHHLRTELLNEPD